jgi:hypothetical protein
MVTVIFFAISQFIEIISGGMFEPIKGYQMRSVYMTEVPIPAHQVVHFKSFNPDFTLTGAQLIRTVTN